MLIMGLCRVLFGVIAFGFCAVTCDAFLRADKRAPLFLTVAGLVALVFFVSLPGLPVELIAVALLAIAAGIILAPRSESSGHVTFDSTATRRRR